MHGAGAGESGKSTILKQMKLIYTKEGISKSEKEDWRVIIFNNLLDGLRMIIDAMEDMGIEFQYDNTTVRVESSEVVVIGLIGVAVGCCPLPLALAITRQSPATNAC